MRALTSMRSNGFHCEIFQNLRDIPNLIMVQVYEKANNNFSFQWKLKKVVTYVKKA